jgi:hypothetical protein
MSSSLIMASTALVAYFVLLMGFLKEREKRFLGVEDGIWIHKGLGDIF